MSTESDSISISIPISISISHFHIHHFIHSCIFSYMDVFLFARLHSPSSYFFTLFLYLLLYSSFVLIQRQIQSVRVASIQSVSTHTHTYLMLFYIALTQFVQCEC